MIYSSLMLYAKHSSVFLLPLPLPPPPPLSLLFSPSPLPLPPSLCQRTGDMVWISVIEGVNRVLFILLINLPLRSRDYVCFIIICVFYSIQYILYIHIWYTNGRIQCLEGGRSGGGGGGRLQVCTY